ncbi:MAG TPA: GMC family oxidoreductase N-terminal domain-containing protein, partial [Oligoflexia bacterium]|nr:GMC family oxidoreductase N-terminal domain-containing protein [Oligoflexia bacterium]
MVDGSTLREHIRENFDVVIVGSGAGGAVVAKELAEGGMRVALVEEGPAFAPQDHRDMAVDAIYRMYRDRGFTTTFGKPAIPIPMGRVLGGTTAINSGTCFRTPSKIFRHWNEELGLHELNEAEFQPIFDRVEREINVEPSDFAVMSRANTIFHELLQNRGTPGKPLRRNIRKCDGCGYCCYGCATGAKQSTDVSYVPKAIRAGATVYTNCTVEKFLI